MMIRNYMDLLPSYLRGPNISRHAAIIDKQNKILLGKLDLIASAFSLNRPILVERVQTAWNGQADITVHIRAPSPIKQLDIDFDSTIPVDDVHETYTEEEVVTQLDITRTIGDEYPIVLSGCDVSMETWDGQTYTKSYPENDSVLGDSADHDEFLDHIGALLSIPRRLFKPYGGQSEEEYKDCYPSYWAKTNLNAQYWTEDDYYYMKRLQFFCENYGQKDTLLLMSEVLYAIDDVALFNMKDRTTSIYDNIRELVGTNLLCFSQGVQYRNIDYSNQEDVLQKYAMITRPMQSISSYFVDYGILNSSVQDNIFTVNGTVEVYDSEIDYMCMLEQATFDVLVDDTKIDTIHSNNNGEFTYSLDVTDYDEGIHVLRFKYADKYELHDISEDSCSIEFNSSGLERTHIDMNTSITAFINDTVHIQGVLRGANNQGIAEKTVKIRLPDLFVADVVTGSDGAFDYSFTVSDWNMDGNEYTVRFDRDLEYLDCSANCTLHMQRHEVHMTVPNLSASVGDTVSVPVSLVDESSNPVTLGTVTAELLRVDKQSIDIVDATGYDYSLMFVSATITAGESEGQDILSCILQIVDTTTEEVPAGFTVSFTDNVLSGVTDVGWSMIFPDLTYDTLAYAQGMISIIGLVSDLSSIIDTTNNVVSIPITVGKQASTPREIIMIQDITEEEAE